MTASHQTPLTQVSYEQRYALAREMYLASAERQFSYGKWLLASLLTMHAGSLLAISQAGDKVTALYHASGAYLIYGVAVTLFCGGVSWINFSIVTNIYFHQVVAIRDSKELKIQGWKKFLARSTFFIAPVLALASLTLFVVAALGATSVL